MADTAIFGSTASNGTVSVRGKDGQPLVELLGRDNEAVIGAGQRSGRPGRLSMYDGNGQNTVNLTTADAALRLGGGVNGTVSVRGKDGQPLVELLGRDDEAVIGAGQTNRPGRLTMYSGAQKQTVNLIAASGTLQLGGGGANGTLSVLGADGQPMVELLARPDECVIGLGQSNRPGRISLYNGARQGTIEINGSVGDITLFNADCAEEFDAAPDEPAAEPGSVVVLGADGHVCETIEAYDTRVAGVVSGAGRYRPALVLDRQGTLPGRLPVALLGKVFCKVDASYGAVAPGDLLTTSPTRGHAMRATDRARMQGTVIGKAMTALEEGCGLLPMLVMLR